MRFLGLFLACLLGMDVHSEITDYLKKAEGKKEEHRIRNIDFIYMINLDQRPEKFQFCTDQLSIYGIVPYRFSAVNGWDLSIEAIDEVGVKYGPWMEDGHQATYYTSEDGLQPQYEYISVIGRTYFGERVYPGAIGIILSHLSVLQDAYDSGYGTIWVMEDDIKVLKDPLMLCDLIDKLDALVGKKGWDILFTDRDTKDREGKTVYCINHGWRPNFSPPNPKKFEEKEIISREFRKIGARYGAYSMIIRKSGIRKLLEFIKKYQIFLPIDMDYTLPNDMRLFTVLDDVVSTDSQAPSDNTAPGYKELKIHEGVDG